jgi:hypothetical protein
MHLTYPARDFCTERKPDLSKYIDDNIRNFDLLANRKRSSLEHTTGSTSTSSTKSSKFSVEAVETSGEPAKSETSAKEAPVKEALVRSTRSKGELLKPLDPTKLVPTAVTNKPDDGVPGIMSKPKRVSFIAAEAEVEAVPIPSAGVTTTSTASVTKDVRTESKSTLSPPAPMVHSQLPSQQPQPHAAWGILGDANRYVEMNGRHYLRLNVLGKGGSSCVYRIIGAEDGQVYAYKRVEVKDSEDVDAVFDSYANEIALLRKLSSVGSHSAEGRECVRGCSCGYISVPFNSVFIPLCRSS